MGNFCEFCGAKLNINELCYCHESVVDRIEISLAHAEATFCEYCGQKLGRGISCNCPEAVAYLTGEIDYLGSISTTTKNVAEEIIQNAMI